MIKKLLSFLIIGVLVGCSGIKNTQKYLAQGNYDQAIDQSLEYLQKNRYGKKAPEYNKLLSESYTKAVDRDKRTLAYLNQDSNPESLERKFDILLQLEKRQNKVRPLLPIDGFYFNIENYAPETLHTRDQLSEYLYNKANDKLASNQKQFIREAHEDLKYIDVINPNYKEVRTLIQQSRIQGTDYVFVTFRNNTEQLLPQKIAIDLLNLDQYNLNNYWTEFQSFIDPTIVYDYEMTLIYDEIIVSPERIKESIFTKQKQITDGTEYVLDENGNVKKDSDGNDIKKEKIIKITSKFHQYLQTKSCNVKARARFINRKTKQVISSIPLSSTFVFEHYYATQKGDKRALEEQYINMLSNKTVPFPSSAQMITDASNDIKSQLQEILTKQSF